MCSRYILGVLEYERMFLEWVSVFWIRIGCSGLRAGVVE